MTVDKPIKLKRGKQGEGGGRKRKFSDVQALDERIKDYFEVESINNKLPTLSGLTLHLGFSQLNALYEYEQTPKFGKSIKKARLIIENALESALISGKPPIGLIFALKNRFKWQDKQDVDITSGGETIGVIAMPTR